MEREPLLSAPVDTAAALAETLTFLTLRAGDGDAVATFGSVTRRIGSVTTSSVGS